MTMMKKKIHNRMLTGAGLVLAAAMLVGGCTETSTNGTDTDDGDTRTGGATDTGSTAEAIPSTLFADAAPAEAMSLADAKASAKPGDAVVFEARVGGRVEPFLADRAVFFVTDASLQSCDQLPGDTCATPWDYCCEPRENLLAHMATVQVVDSEGRPVRQSLADSNGLEPLQTVVITGTVDQIDEVGTFVVNAESIHVREG